MGGVGCFLVRVFSEIGSVWTHEWNKGVVWEGNGAEIKGRERIRNETTVNHSDGLRFLI